MSSWLAGKGEHHLTAMKYPQQGIYFGKIISHSSFLHTVKQENH